MFSNMIKFTKQNALYMLIILVIIFPGVYVFIFGYDFLQRFSDGPTAGQSSYSSLAVLIQLISLTGIILVISQVKMANDQSRMNMSYELYKENTDIRQLHGQAYRQLQEIEKSCGKLDCFSTRAEFDRFYSAEQFKEIRRMAYHFEYLGYLVRSRKVHFDLIFDPITFPDWLIEESAALRKKARAVFPDFWEGTEYLYNEYQDARAASRKRRNKKERNIYLLKRFEKYAKELSENRKLTKEDRLERKLEKKLDMLINDHREKIMKSKLKTDKFEKLFLFYNDYRTLDFTSATGSEPADKADRGEETNGD